MERNVRILERLDRLHATRVGAVERQCGELGEVLRIGQTDEDMDVWVYEVNKTVSECYEEMGDYAHALEFMLNYRDTRKGFGTGEEELKETNQKISELQSKLKRK